MDRLSKLLALIHQRNVVEVKLSEFRKQWNQCGADIIALLSPHKIGDVVSYNKGGKTHRLQVDDIVLAQRITATTKEGQASTDNLSLIFYGRAVLANGNPGVARGQFSIPLTNLL